MVVGSARREMTRDKMRVGCDPLCCHYKDISFECSRHGQLCLWPLWPSSIPVAVVVKAETGINTR